jgi:hypothetical protein
MLLAKGSLTVFLPRVSLPDNGAFACPKQFLI